MYEYLQILTAQTAGASVAVCMLVSTVYCIQQMISFQFSCLSEVPVESVIIFKDFSLKNLYLEITTTFSFQILFLFF